MQTQTQTQEIIETDYSTIEVSYDFDLMKIWVVIKRASTDMVSSVKAQLERTKTAENSISKTVLVADLTASNYDWSSGYSIFPQHFGKTTMGENLSNVHHVLYFLAQKNVITWGAELKKFEKILNSFKGGSEIINHDRNCAIAWNKKKLKINRMNFYPSQALFENAEKNGKNAARALSNLKGLEGSLATARAMMRSSKDEEIKQVYLAQIWALRLAQAVRDGKIEDLRL